MNELLIESEHGELQQYEQTIERGLKTFVDVGNALLAIRDKRLYRQEYKTFEEYCQGRWGMERRHAYRLIDAAQAVENVSNWTQTLPATESQARPLTKLEPELQPIVWQKSVETAPNGKVTAAHVEATAKAFVSPQPLDEYEEMADEAEGSEDGYNWTETVAKTLPQVAGDTEHAPLFCPKCNGWHDDIDLSKRDRFDENLEKYICETVAYCNRCDTTISETLAGLGPGCFSCKFYMPDSHNYESAFCLKMERSLPGDLMLCDGDLWVWENAQSIEDQPSIQGKMAVHFSSRTPEHYTPKEIIDATIAVMGAIDLDPCSNSKDTPSVPALDHYTAEDDGLSLPWFGRVYMNPPYGRLIGDWTRKLAAEYEAGNITEAIALVPGRIDTQWWQTLGIRYPACFYTGRLTFIGNDDPAPFPSTIFYLGEDVAKFYKTFSALGQIWTRIDEHWFTD